MSTHENIEEIVIDEEIDEILKSYCRYTFPVITLEENGEFVYFNKESAPIVPDNIKWGVTTEYVVALPVSKNNPNGYILRPSDSKYLGKVGRFPSRLRREKKVQAGTYKLYKYKDGFAFKRYEPLKEDKE